MTPRSHPPHPTEPFSVVLGGPLYQICLRTRLLAPDIDLVGRRIVAAIIVTWIPLVVLTSAGQGFMSGAEVTFLLDVDVHVRFLIALPLLIAAEPVVHRYLGITVRQFTVRDIIAPADRGRLEAIIASGTQWRNSVAVEVALLLFSTFVGYWFWREEIALRVSTWYVAAGAHGEERLSAAGWWYAFISLNLFRFFLLRWYFRLGLWYVFLWRVSRLPLRLNPLHPDRAGGIGFLVISLRALTPVLLAHTVILAGAIGNHIWHEGMALPRFQLEIIGVLIFLVALAVVPLTFYMGPLWRAKLEGMEGYGLLATRYVHDFRQKWIQGSSPESEQLIGSSDIQSLADLGNADGVIQQMRLLPADPRSIITLAIVIAVPFAPLILTLIPLNELITRVIGRLM